MRRLHRLALAAAGSIIAAGLAVGGWFLYRYHGPHAPVQIYRGLTYGCDRLPETDQGGGLVHWVRADLTVPGVRLYATPLDPTAVAAGWEYHLRRVSAAVADEDLAAAANGTLFASDSHWVRLAGDLARSSETVVSDGVANHVDPNSYLLWWDAAGVGHLEGAKPPPPAALARAVWGIGGQMFLVLDRVVNGWAGTTHPDARTAVAADPAHHLVWIVCFDRATGMLVGKQLVRMGATMAVMVDGGTSTAMALGSDARGVRTGTVTGNWRPVATVFGFRADPLP